MNQLNERRSKRTTAQILKSKWIYLINYPTNMQVIDFAVQEARYQKPDSCSSRYIQQQVNNVYSYDDIPRILRNVYKSNSHAFKINISFGFVFERPTGAGHSIEDAINNPTDRFREITEAIVHEPSNNYYLNKTHAIRNANDMENLILSKFSDDDIREKLEKEALDTKTRLIGIFSMGIKITLLDYAIGSKLQLPKYIKDSHSIISLDDVENNMCFWACIAVMLGAKRDSYVKLMKQLFTQTYGHSNYKSYFGFDYNSELEKFEEKFQYAINIVNFKGEDKIEYIRKSDYNAIRTPKYLNFYENHFSYITNFEKLGKIFTCSECGYKARRPIEINRHSCNNTTKDYFVSEKILFGQNQEI